MHPVRDAPRRPMPAISPRWRRRWRRRPGPWDCRLMSGPRHASAPISTNRAGCASPPAGCGCCSSDSASPAAAPNTASTTCKTRRKSPPVKRRCGWRGKKVQAEPDRYELHYEDETHLETNPYLSRVWHRVGAQPTAPAAGTNRRLTVFGSVEAQGRGRIELLTVRQDSVGFTRYLAALDARHAATGRAAWLEVIPLARYRPHLNPKEHEWRLLKRDHRGHLAGSLREFVDTAAAGLARLGGDDCAIIDAVPQWWLDGHRKEPTGRPPGRPTGAKDSRPRKPRVKNLPAHT